MQQLNGRKALEAVKNSPACPAAGSAQHIAAKGDWFVEDVCALCMHPQLCHRTLQKQQLLFAVIFRQLGSKYIEPAQFHTSILNSR